MQQNMNVADCTCSSIYIYIYFYTTYLLYTSYINNDGSTRKLGREDIARSLTEKGRNRNLNPLFMPEVFKVY